MRFKCLAVLAILVAVLAVMWQGFCLRHPTANAEILLLVYQVLLYWHQGFTVEQAVKDLAYYLVSVGSTSLVFLPSQRLPGADVQFLPTDDHVTGVCKTSLYTNLVSDGVGTINPYIHAMQTSDPVSAAERVRLYLQACMEIYGELDPKGQQKQVLDRMTPGLGVNKTTPVPILASEPDGFANRLKKRAEESEARPDFSKHWVPPEELGPYAQAYVRHGFRPVRPEVIKAKDIPDAILKGRVVKFDATEILGKEMFNKSMADFAEMHKDIAHEIPLYRQMGASAPGGSGWESLEMYAKRTEQYRRSDNLRFPEYLPWREDSMSAQEQAQMQRQGDHQTWYLRLLSEWLIEPFLKFNPAQLARHARTQFLQCALNMRRLPRLPQNVEKLLGSPEWLERTWNMLWLGPVDDCIHYDDPDNLLIAVHGEIYVTVWTDPSDNELLRAGGERGCWAGGASFWPTKLTRGMELEQHKWLRRFPAISFKLEPGMGVTVPSTTYHSLAMPDGDRVLMNCFFVPKYGKLWDTNMSKYSFYRKEKQTDEYAALRSLKLSTVARVWDKHKIGGWFEATKLEFL